MAAESAVDRGLKTVILLEVCFNYVVNRFVFFVGTLFDFSSVPVHNKHEAGTVHQAMQIKISEPRFETMTGSPVLQASSAIGTTSSGGSTGMQRHKQSGTSATVIVYFLCQQLL